jgi:cytosine/adenosine deaminase-related metal-dependent hydrolase
VSARYLLRGGCVLTLGARTPNHPRADVLIEDGRIAEVGPALRARDAEMVDASEAVVMPGFVDTHRHAWRSLFRNLGGASADAELDDRFGPDEVYAATLIGLLGAVEAGITTVVDWADLRTDALVEAALQAHADAELRTVFVHAPRTGPVGGLRERMARIAEAAGPSTSVALGSDRLGAADLERATGEWTLARELGLRVHAHAGSEHPGPGLVSRLGVHGLLGDDVALVHCSKLDEADLEAIASSGAAVSIAPTSEMADGRGSPPIQPLIGRDIRPGLGIDDERVGPGDMFAQMRAAISLQHATVFDRKLAGKAGLPRLMNTRDVIRFATVEGARVAGLRGATGSLERGLAADVVVLRTDRPNIFPVNDPIGAVVWGMDTSNVDWVFAGGRVLMREGVLKADVARARGLATEAARRVVSGSGVSVGAARGGDA